MNLEQTEAGLAWHHKRYEREQSASDCIKYSDAELEARRRKIGLWHDTNPVPPRDYRQVKRERMKEVESFVGKTRMGTTP